MTDLIATHWLSSRPSRSLNDPNLSDFVCSCGVEFVASDLTPSLPRNVPTLPQVHQHIVAGGGPVRTITGAESLADVPEHAAVADAHGVLTRRHRGRLAWSRQDGSITGDVTDIALPVTVWWEPREEGGER